MKYWIITDTHFGHDKLIEYCARPINFSDLILKRLKDTVKDEDIVIHLGDFCIGNDQEWHNKFMSEIAGKKWLIKGNHDRKTNTWYLTNGWDFVADQMRMRIFGLNIVFSHAPVVDDRFDLNIHGHLHNLIDYEHSEYLQSIKTPKHMLLKMEHEYTPFNLRTIASKKNNSCLNIKKF